MIIKDSLFKGAKLPYRDGNYNIDTIFLTLFVTYNF